MTDQAPQDIFVASLYSPIHDAPLVRLTINGPDSPTAPLCSVYLPPGKALRIGLSLLAASESSIADAFLMRTCRDIQGAKTPEQEAEAHTMGAAFVAGLREYREQIEDEAMSVEDADEKLAADTERSALRAENAHLRGLLGRARSAVEQWCAECSGDPNPDADNALLQAIASLSDDS